jgi:CDP-diacylglycerol---glycerol-3-phosphate 3-phosphatidyltransferase
VVEGSVRQSFWNIPNGITVARIFLVPVMVVLLRDEPTPIENVICCVIFVGAMITDVIDGWLARKWNLTSPVGAYLDPLADKLMVITVLVMLIPLGRVAAWLVALLLCRELAITALRGIASQEGIVLAAETLGKLKTSFQATAIGMLLWHNPTIGIDVHSAGTVILWIATVFAVVSAVQYFVDFFRKTTVVA